MNLSLKIKIISVCCAAVVVSLVISTFGAWRLNLAMDQYKQIAEVNLENIRAILTMEKATIKIEAAANTLLGTTATLQEVEEVEAIFKNTKSDFEKSSLVYEGLPFADGEEEKWKVIKNEFYPKYIGTVQKIISLSKTGKAEDRTTRDTTITNQLKTLIDERNKVFNTLVEFQNGEIKIRSSNAAAESQRMAWLLPLLLSLAGILSVLISIFVGSAVAKTITQIVSSIDESTSQVSLASTQIASTSQQLSEATTEQASSLGETAAALEEITAMISKSSDSASSTEASSTSSHEKAEEGRRAVDQMLSSMEEISQSNNAIVNQVNQSNQEMFEIVRVIQEIGNKTKVINEIVFQTKLLSFNASVEAARAGEHGKGFAVVAEEVGSLAQMSGNAAKEITDMLDSSIVKVDSIVKNTKLSVESLVQQGKEKVEQGIEVARQCSSVLDEIVDNTLKVTGLAQEISTASREQSQGVSEINKAMSQLDTVTQQNSSNSEATASSAEQLSMQAKSLKSAVVDLVKVVQGTVVNNTDFGNSTNSSFVKKDDEKSKVVHITALTKKPNTDSVPL